MTHIHKDEYTDYINEAISEERRESVESHLLACDMCITIYEKALEDNATRLPELHDSSTFTDDIMAKISTSKVEQNERKIRFYETTFLHYTIALALTVILMSSGVFQTITNYVDDIQNTTFRDEGPSVTEQLVKKIFANEEQ
ncbi:hypothetical protein [Evansella cellulosilytica]|uniref:Zinc-finger domain-containing protein n=1 Tax=Evansella cellulosilytica (strain ATCC 21833 / DSM 2522 / FERM P-1141 / JCM 9156 / N-4) TaxID=649639 RepID=E6U0T6_EVAC2|nr:hypothetical protein [Evansella cellulosilytica]ADU29134.1 hypothetical protein Bcell_0857 [Evansella cellulosilytica DSM 2522]